MQKYKLINKTTGEEHLCDKVSIDGFDYYYDDSPFGMEYYFDTAQHSIRNGSNNHVTGSYKKKIIATTNPGIDISKVIDEVAKKSFDIAKQTGITDELQVAYIATAWYDGYSESQETHPNSDEDMIEFAEWCQNPNNCLFLPQTKTWYYKTKKYTSQELLNIWKEQKVKILFYE